MRTRIISGAVMIAAVVGILAAGGYVAGCAIMLIAVGSYFELCRACGLLEEKKIVNGITIAGYVATILYYINMMWGCSEYATTINTIILLVVILWQLAVYVFTYPKYKSGQVMSGVFNLLYAPFMLSYLYLILKEFDKGLYLVILVFIASSVSDMCAYFVGVSIGKHKLAPVVSPKKSIEGSIGGILGAAIVGFVFGLILNKNGIFGSEALWAFAVIGGVGSIISQIGDLAASAIKRDHGIKDYSHLIPGHGGLMDRLDSICVTAPIIYYLAMFLIK